MQKLGYDDSFVPFTVEAIDTDEQRDFIEDHWSNLIHVQADEVGWATGMIGDNHVTIPVEWSYEIMTPFGLLEAQCSRNTDAVAPDEDMELAAYAYHMTLFHVAMDRDLRLQVELSVGMYDTRAECEQAFFTILDHKLGELRG